MIYDVKYKTAPGQMETLLNFHYFLLLIVGVEIENMV